MNLKEAFAAHGLRAQFNGKPAKLLPLSAEVIASMNADDLAKAGQDLVAGQMIASWNERIEKDGQTAHRRAGQVTMIGANNDITLMVERTDGTDYQISANDLAGGAISTLTAERNAAKNRNEVAEANEKALADYDAAVARGEAVEAPEERKPDFDVDAFDKFANFRDCVKAGLAAMLEDPLTDLPARTKVHSDMSRLRDAETDVLDYDQKAKVAEAKNLRQQIGLINPAHADAAVAIIPDAYEGDNKAQRDLFDSLPITGRGHTLEQHQALRSVSQATMTNLFKSVTTTPIHQVSRRQLSNGDFQRITQELARSEDRDFGPVATARMSAITRDGMPGYKWAGRIFSKGDADALVMRDEVGAYVYTWDKASRVQDLNVNEAFLDRPGLEDVPSDEELTRLRAVLRDITYDNGDEIDFAWDDEQVMNDILDDEDDGFGINDGPRPDGYQE